MKRWVIILVSLGFLSGCGGGWFGAKEEARLPGKRISVLALERALEPDPQLADLAVRLPRPYLNSEWPQAGGVPNHVMHHLSAKGDLRLLWSADIGEGSSRVAQLISAPVVASGMVYTIDVEARVSAFDANTGRIVWRRRLAPKGMGDGVLGGGVAWGNGRLLVTTGFAEVIALDGDNGAEIWRRSLNGPIRAAPTLFKGRVFVMTIANETYALDAADGKVMWNHIGITETAGLLGGASPTADGSTILASYSSGELVALRFENGRVVWSDSMTSLRRADPISAIAHIRGRPVIDRGRVIVTANSGRTFAIDLRTGTRLWERRLGASSSPWVAGEFIYIVTNTGELVCLSRKTGGIKWVTQLPRFDDPEDREGPIFWSGPVLAGDRLLIGGSNEQVWSVSPYTGKLLGRIKLRGAVYIEPVVANDTVYILTDEAKLFAFR
jgi:outer membrane protein assembly factor BamB